MKLKLHYVEFRRSSSTTGAHLRKGKLTRAMSRPFEAETKYDVPAAAQKLWNAIVAEGKEVEFRRVEVYALDWKPASN